jgi:diadenosine tetraphosphatase ApaH/serine/threonine PP2A family protein phosphatase
MRFAIFGDVHANLEALETVLEDARSEACDSYVCIGDVVGYNANPADCLNIIRDLDCPVVKGNHDETASSDDPMEGLNPLAQRALEWTRNALSNEQKDWLRALRLQRQVQGFTIVHATLDSPGSWGYVTNRYYALNSFNYQFTQLCFHGHTHTPRIFVKDSRVEELPVTPLRIRPQLKYFINVGSVGQPRDGDWRAAYAVYDSADATIEIRRLEYDVESAQRKIREAGLPETLAARLAVGR